MMPPNMMNVPQMVPPPQQHMPPMGMPPQMPMMPPPGHMLNTRERSAGMDSICEFVLINLMSKCVSFTDEPKLTTTINHWRVCKFEVQQLATSSSRQIHNWDGKLCLHTGAYFKNISRSIRSNDYRPAEQDDKRNVWRTRDKEREYRERSRERGGGDRGKSEEMDRQSSSRTREEDSPSRDRDRRRDRDRYRDRGSTRR